MSKKESKGLGVFIVSLSIIQMVLCGISALSTVITILFRNLLDKELAFMGYKALPLNQLIIHLIIYMAIILCLKLVLDKNLLGILAYFIVCIWNFIYSINTEGLKIDTMLPVILPILMVVFIFNKKNIFTSKNQKAC